HDAARLDDGDPALPLPLPGAHPGLRRLLRDRLVGEDRDPHLPTTLDVTGHRHAAGLDLAVRDPSRLHRDDRVVPVLDLGVARGFALHPAPMHLAVLHALPVEHHASPPSASTPAGAGPGATTATAASPGTG